jgi:hypothetical protein
MRSMLGALVAAWFLSSMIVAAGAGPLTRARGDVEPVTTRGAHRG